jgi:arylsulfatase A-like enzyme
MRPSPGRFSGLLALAWCASAVACSSAPPAQKAAPAPRTRPNIVFIVSDDATWQAISTYGHWLPIETPNLDRLAARGMRFDRSTVANSICSPSRATLLTGTHSHVNGVVDNYTPFDGRQLTYPKLLQAAGYETALIGKWHLHSLPTGFDHYDILDGQGRYYDPDFIVKGRDTPYKEQGHTDAVIGDKSVRWLEHGRDRKRPFSLNVHFKVPHGPFMPPSDLLAMIETMKFPEPPTLFDDYAGKSRAARDAIMRLADHFGERDLKLVDIAEPSGAELDAWKAFHARIREQYKDVPRSGRERARWVYQRFLQDYAGCMLMLDRQVGRLLDTLDRLGLADDTVVLFAGDQGFFLGEHGWWDKRFMYEPSFRTPLLVRAPGITRPGSHTGALVQNIDWAPTILDLAGVPVPEEMQGRSLVPLLRGQVPGDWRDSLYYHYYEGPEADHHVARHEGVSDGRYKLISFYELDQWELYDLETDPHETRNRIDDASLAQVQGELKAELGRLRAQYGVPPNDAVPRTKRRGMQTIGVRYPEPAAP